MPTLQNTKTQPINTTILLFTAPQSPDNNSNNYDAFTILQLIKPLSLR